ncbi:PAS domain-containing protein [Halomicroarcula sp. GCM10025710]
MCRPRHLRPRRAKRGTQVDDVAAVELVENIPVGILAENADREVLFANERFCTLLDIDADPQELVGTDCANAARRYKHLFTDPDRFVEQTDESVENSVPVEQESFDLVDGRTLERSAIPVDLDGDTLVTSGSTATLPGEHGTSGGSTTSTRRRGN